MWFIDKNVALYMHNHINKDVFNFFVNFSHWFNNGILFLILVSIFTKFDKKKIIDFIILMIVVSIFIFSLKYIVARQRPFSMIGMMSFDDLNPYRSFPSGHSAFATIMMLYIITDKNEWYIKLLVLFISLMIIISRIIITAHYVSDVLFSISLVIIIFVLWKFINNKKNMKS